MEEKIYLIDYNKEKRVTVANKIIHGKQTMTRQTAKLLRLLITQIAKEDKDLKTYKCDIKELAKFLGIEEKNMYRDIQKACEELMKSIIYIKDEKSWTMLHWTSRAEYKDGIVTLKLSDEIKQYVIELKNYFTQYKIENILNFNSFYAIRIYEILKCEKAEKKEKQNRNWNTGIKRKIRMYKEI